MLVELEPLLNAAEVAGWLGVSTKQILRYAESGSLPATRLSPRVVRFRREDVEEFIKERSA